MSTQYNQKNTFMYDYRFYTGQKFYYTKNSGVTEHDSYFSKSCAATKAIFKGLNYAPMLYHELTTKSVITPSGPTYFKIYSIKELYEELKANRPILTKTGGGPSFWCGGDDIFVWNSSGGQVDANTYNPPNSNNLHFKVRKFLPYYARTLFNQILTGKDFSLPEDGTIIYPSSGTTPTELQKQQQKMIKKVTQWGITVKNGKLHCTGPVQSGTSYGAMEGKTITVPVVVELANLNF